MIQATYRTPKGDDKQLDYVLINRKNLRYIRDAEANDKIHTGSDHRCVMAHFVFPATKKNDSQIKCKSEKNTSETAHILHQDDKKLNSQRSTKFEDEYTELEKRLIVQKTKEDKMKKEMQKMKKGSQQSTLEGVNDATAADPSRVKDTPLDESAIDADAKHRKVKGPQQQTLKEGSMKMRQTECEARRRMSRTKQSREKPQPLQQDRHRSRRSPQSQER